MSGAWRIALYRGRYAAVRRTERGTERVSLKTRDLDTAKARLIDFTTKPAETVAEIMAIYIADKKATALKPEDIERCWKNAKDHFGHLRPDQISREVCRAYIAKRERQGRKPATIQKELRTVRAALNHNKQGARAVFEMPASPPPRDRFLSREEARALVNAANGTPHLQAFIVLSLATAARSSALLELTWDRVDEERRRITLALDDGLDARRKRRSLSVPINDQALALLKDLADKSAGADHVISWGGHRVKSVKKGFASACKAAGLDDVTPHTLRHTAASWMAMARVPMLEISRLLGHSSVAVTEKVYAHLHPDYLRDATDALEF